MVTVVELVSGHYEVRESCDATSYIWCPGCVTVECECGERLRFGISDTAACGACGRDHSGLVTERWDELQGSGDDAPWADRLPERPEKSERLYWSELNDLD